MIPHWRDGVLPLKNTRLSILTLLAGKWSGPKRRGVIYWIASVTSLAMSFHFFLFFLWQ